MLSKKVKLENIEKFLTDIFSKQSVHLSNTLAIVDKDDYFYGTSNDITTGIGGVLKFPRMFTKIIYNGQIVTNHEEFWNILETKYNNLK